MPSHGFANFGLGPRTIVKTKELKSSGLLAPGTLFTAKYRLQIDPSKNLEALGSIAKMKFEETGMRWRDTRNGAPGILDL